jgi:hypothetical protein
LEAKRTTLERWKDGRCNGGGGGGGGGWGVVGERTFIALKMCRKCPLIRRKARYGVRK